MYSVFGQCGDHRDSSSGTIESPNYPNGYPVEQDCIWTVAVEGSVDNIKLSFSSFDLQPRSIGGECTDYVAIFGKQLGKDAGVVPEAKICGSALPDSMQIEGSSMTVQFVSDSIPDSHSGFSLHYQTNFKEGSSVSQATAGIVAAVFCAIVFVGVGMLRCIMLGACNCCGSDLQDNTPNRQEIGHSESYTYQGDFPPSYSTVMHHPERYPTPESSPQMVTQNRNHTLPRQNPNGRTFSVRSSSSSDEDEEESPPPPYPGNVTQENDVDVNVTTENEPNTASNNYEMPTHVNEEQSRHPEATTVDLANEVVGDEESSSTTATEEIVLDIDTTAQRSQQEGNGENFETSQTGEILEEIETFI